LSPINPTEGFEQINREAREGFERICPRRPFVIPQEVNLTDIDRYLDTPPIVFKLSKSDNQTQWILNWWDGNKYEFPCMAQAARDYLPIPASEVDVERLFNVGRDVLGVRRFAMSEETLRTVMMLKDVLRRKETGQY
jgi:hypothetical protein